MKLLKYIEKLLKSFVYLTPFLLGTVFVLSMIFFRAEDIDHAIGYISEIFQSFFLIYNEGQYVMHVVK